jgi:hypothetical protein
MEKSTNKPILIGVAFLLPLLFIGVILLTSTIPSSRLTSEYDFVYATCSEGQNSYRYNCSNYLNRRYQVVNGTLNVIEENYRSRLFLHDVELNQSREITLADAQALSLRDLITSPDDVSVEWEASRSTGFFLFYDARSDSGYYLTKGNAKKELNLIEDNNRSYYQGNFMFVGWVMDR